MSEQQPTPEQSAAMAIDTACADLAAALDAARDDSAVGVERARLQGAQRLLRAARALLPEQARPTDHVPGASLAAHRVDALEEERYRLSREIHDGPAQLLTNLALHLEVVERLIGDDDTRAVAEVHALREEATAATREIRRFIYDLVPPGLPQGDLGLALQGHCARLRDRFGLTVHLDLGADPPLGRARQATVFRVVQEALQNVLRHSGTAEAWVELRLEGEKLVVSIRDEGRGFDLMDPRLLGGWHLGLAGMRERARLAGGQLSIQSTPAQGTLVTLRLPV